MRCLKISFVGLMLTALVQTAIVYYTNSVALLGDTVHNYADALTAVPLAIAFLSAVAAPAAPNLRLRPGRGPSGALTKSVYV
jgi:divalent metal cation (Fe/Co/Zn/Cd) transporter